jgi:NADH-quinone oxidoreductase subunit N
VLDNFESLRYLVPETFLSVSIVALLVWSFLRSARASDIRFFYFSAIGATLITVFLELFTYNGGSVSLFYGMLSQDSFSHLLKLLCVTSTLMFLLFAFTSRETTGSSLRSMEYMLLILANTLGMMFLVSSTNLLMLYLSLELLSFTSYILTGFVERDDKTTEAAIKYLLYGGIASGVMVYGLSLLYGITGSLDYLVIHEHLSSNAVSESLLYISILFVLAAFGYKIAAFPFHSWCPDVYEGSPTPFTAFLSVGPKAAGFAMAVRFFYQVFLEPSGGEVLNLVGGFDWTLLIAIMSAMTMTIGNLAALQQVNMRRLLAYSSIAHAGYLLMALASHTAFGINALFFYLAVYFVMNFGAFLVVMIVSDEYHTDTIDGYDGLGWRGRQGAFLASMFTVYLFSLTGIPPFAGFIGKVYLLLAIFKKGSALYWLAVVAVINTVISLFYYARIVRFMFLSSDRKGSVRHTASAGRYFQYAVLACLTLATIILGIYWAPLDHLSSKAAEFIF